MAGLIWDLNCGEVKERKERQVGYAEKDCKYLSVINCNVSKKLLFVD